MVGTVKWFNAEKGFGFIERRREDVLFIFRNQTKGIRHLMKVSVFNSM